MTPGRPVLGIQLSVPAPMSTIPMDGLGGGSLRLGEGPGRFLLHFSG
jgi:hypothetical protein